MSNEALKDVVAASIAGAAGIVVGQPFDIVKVRLQTAKQAGLQAGLWDTAAGIVRQAGFAGLFRGVLPPVVANAPINAVLFAVEGATVRYFEKSGTNISTQMQHVLGGCVAGLSQSVLACPAELLKIREQLPNAGGSAAFSGPIDVARHVYRTNGVRGLFRGMSLTAMRDAPAFGLYFGVYDSAKHLMGLHCPALWEAGRAVEEQRSVLGTPGGVEGGAVARGQAGGGSRAVAAGAASGAEGGGSPVSSDGDATSSRRRPRHQSLGGRAITTRLSPPRSPLTPLPDSMGAGDFEFEAVRVLRAMWARPRGPGRKKADGAPAGIVEDIEDGGTGGTQRVPATGGAVPATPRPGAAAAYRDDPSRLNLAGAAPARPEPASSAVPGDRVGVGGQLLAGALAGMASWLFLHPVDVLKTRAQALPDGASVRERRVSAVLQAVLREQGYRGLLRGIQASVLRAAPVSAVIFVVYEFIQPKLPF